MIQSLYIAGTPDTPQVDFNIEKGTFAVEGISIPENTTVFYEPLIIWIEQFLNQQKNEFELKIFLHYYNTSSNISLINFLTKIQMHEKSNLCTIIWCYEKDDEDMMYKGEELSDITNLKFQFHLA
jgi:SiaC family regulatory phosphoprotein